MSPVDEYLAAQADLRVVERFARTDVSGRTGQWSELIPLSAPPAGEQYRFEVDLDACSGCKACVTACHSLNGLDEGESFRAVGVVVAPAEPAARPVTLQLSATAVAAPAQQTVTTACHHCADPGCLTGCPAEAYVKDPVTGIVKHLDDACIGCQYCTLTCPYDVPVYNSRLGIVRKCDMCSDRLAEGEAPACIQGCPTQAISITTVSTSPIADEVAGSTASDARLVPGAAPSHLTNPTTLYRGRSLSVEGSVAVDTDDVVPQHAHLPLVVMLVVSQWSVGVLLSTALFGNGWTDGERSVGLGAGAALGASAALASFTHLGQPLKAWRAVLGWRHSWLSREVIVLSAYIGVALAAVALSVTGLGGPALVTSAAALAAAVGAAAVACSAMVYVATGRTWWAATQTSIRFGGTVALAGLAWLASGANWLGVGAAVVLLAVVAAKLKVERSVFASDDVDLCRTAALLSGSLAPDARFRRQLCTTAGGVIVAGAFVGAVSESAEPLAVAVVALGSLILAGAELIERRLFFQACAPSTMPGAHR